MSVQLYSTAFQNRAWDDVSIERPTAPPQNQSTWNYLIDLAKRGVNIAVATLEGAFELDTVGNRNEIFTRVKNQLDTGKHDDDEILLRYCREYGKIVFGPSGNSRLSNAMTQTLREDIPYEMILPVLSNSSRKVDIFFAIWISLIQRAYQLDHAQFIYRRAGAGIGIAAPLLFPIPTYIGAALSAFAGVRAYFDVNQRPTITQGISNALIESGDSQLSYLHDVEDMTRDVVADEITNRSLSKVIKLAFLTGQATIEAIGRQIAEVRDANVAAKKAMIKRYFETAFNEAKGQVLPGAQSPRVQSNAAASPQQTNIPNTSLADPSQQQTAQSSSQATVGPATQEANRQNDNNSAAQSSLPSLEPDRSQISDQTLPGSIAQTVDQSTDAGTKSTSKGTKRKASDGLDKSDNADELISPPKKR